MRQTKLSCTYIQFCFQISRFILTVCTIDIIVQTEKKYTFKKRFQSQNNLEAEQSYTYFISTYIAMHHYSCK